MAVDLSLYRSASARWRPFPGAPDTVVGLRPLPAAVIEEAGRGVEERWRSLGLRPSGPLFDVDVDLAVLARAVVLEDGQGVSTSALAQLSAVRVRQLAGMWAAVQVESSPPDLDALEALLELQCSRHEGEGVQDVINAGHSETAVDFYGVAVGNLTDGQLLYFSTCKTVHYNITQEKDRWVSKKLLEQRADRLASRLTSRRDALTDASGQGQSWTLDSSI